jgi:hypothetical protein
MFGEATAMRMKYKMPDLNRAGVFTAVLTFIYSLSLLFPDAYLRAEERPVIKVDFRFEGSLFERIPEEKRTAIEVKAENELCDLAERRWGFLDWTNDPSTAATSAEWIVTIKIETLDVTNNTGGLSEATIVTLNHTGSLASEATQFIQTEGNETIYPIGSLIPVTDPTALGDDITSQLDHQLLSLLESSDVKTYLGEIPIVERIIADAENSRLVVPLRKSDLRTEEDSVLWVKFKDSKNRSSRLDLETFESVTEAGQYEGYVVAWVKDLRLHQVNINTPTDWDDKLLPVINSATDVKVYMNEYNASLTPGSVAVGGVVSEPEQ